MKKPLIIVLCLFLTSCSGGASQYAMNSAMNKANLEAQNCPSQAVPSQIENAWRKITELNETQCPHGTENKPLERPLAMKRHECYSGLVRKYAKPVSKNKGAIEAFLTDAKSYAVSYRDGVMSRDEANQNTQISFQKYLVKEVSYFKLAQCQNASLQRHVMPSYQNKGLLADFMAKKLAIGLSVDEGKLSPAKAEVELQKLLADFTAKEQGANMALQRQNEQEWQDYADRLGKVSRDVAKANQKSSPVPPIRTTNCNMVGGSLTCTSF